MMSSKTGLATKQISGDLEVGVISDGEKILFSTFSFSNQVNSRLNVHMEKESLTHDVSLDEPTEKLLSDALEGKDVFRWEILSPTQYKVLRKLFETKIQTPSVTLCHATWSRQKTGLEAL